MRLHFVERTSDLMTRFNVRICGFTPLYLERANIRASDLLVDFFAKFCLKLDLQRSDGLIVSGDYGSDVVRAVDIIVPDMTEWCVSHLKKYISTSARWTKESFREIHFKLVHLYIRKWIRSMAITVATSRHGVQGMKARVPSTSRTVQKRRQTSDHNVDVFLVMAQALGLRGDD